MVKPELTKLAYAVKCYFILWAVKGLKPRRGELSDISTKYVQHRRSLVNNPDIRLIHFPIDHNPSLPKRGPIGGVLFRSSYNRSSYKRFNIDGIRCTGFNTALTIDGNPEVCIKTLELENCAEGLRTKGDNEMVLKVGKAKMTDVDRGVYAPDHAEISIDEIEVARANTVFDIFVPEHKLTEVGLPKDIPQDQLKDLIKKIQEEQMRPEPHLIELISNHSLSKWMGLASNAITVATPFVMALMKLAASN